MHWALKAALANGLSVVPGGRRLHALLQRYVTHSIPPSERDFFSRSHAAIQHLAAYRRWGTSPGDARLDRATFVEFGAGWDLGIALIYRLAGVGAQFVFDIEPLVNAELVRLAATRARTHADHLFTASAHAPDLARLPHDGPATQAMLYDWLRAAGIEYRAPGDARRTELPSGSVDAVTSTFTLEHIPPDDIAAIFAETLRTLRPGGVMSGLIDMSDHFSHADPGISPWHFLRFSEQAWRIVNSDLLYQNRLRASGYVAMARSAGFEIAQAATEVPAPRPAVLPPVHPDLPAASDSDDLLAVRLHLVAVRPA